jgi:hypothetical protein
MTSDELLGSWPLPPDLNDLHNEVINLAVTYNLKAAESQARHGRGPLAYKALQRLHRTGIATHRSVRVLCESGWTPVSAVLLRTMLDLLVSVFAIGRKPQDAEWMGFRFMAHAAIEGMNDEHAEPHHQAGQAALIFYQKSLLSAKDDIRARATISSYEVKVPPYWYWPEVPNPGSTIFQYMPQLFDLWKTLCGSTHGSDIGAVFFADDPNNLGISPEEHPRKTRIAILASSRLLLDISHARAQCEGVADEAEYKRIVRDLIKPQEAKTKK